MILVGIVIYKLLEFEYSISFIDPSNYQTSISKYLPNNMCLHPHSYLKLNIMNSFVNLMTQLQIIHSFFM